MEDWQSALLVAAIAAIAGVVGAVIGRERWPADLRDAKRLAEIVEKMAPGTKEREFAEMYRDDLAARWIVGRVIARSDLRRELGLSLMGAGLVILLAAAAAGAASLVGFAIGKPIGLLTLLATLIASAALCFGLGAWLGNSYLKAWNGYLTAFREARGMRAPITDWVNEFDRTHRLLKRKTPGAKHPPSPILPEVIGEEGPAQR